MNGESQFVEVLGRGWVHICALANYTYDPERRCHVLACPHCGYVEYLNGDGQVVEAGYGISASTSVQDTQGPQ